MGPGIGFPSGVGFDRTAWSVALNATHQIGAFGVGGRIGYSDVRDSPELLAEAGGSALRLSGERAPSMRKSFLGVDASYDLSRNWQFHGGAIYRRDEGRSGTALVSGLGALQAGDEKEFGVGVRYYGWRNFRLNVEFLKTRGASSTATNPCCSWVDSTSDPLHAHPRARTTRTTSHRSGAQPRALNASGPSRRAGDSSQTL